MRVHTFCGVESAKIKFDSRGDLQNIVGKSGFWAHVLDFLAVSGVICLSFRDRFGILLEKRPSPDESG